MKRALAVSVVLLSASGCLAPVTRRLDLTNQQLATMRTQLDEANQRMADAQTKLAESNQRAQSLEAKLDESNRRVGIIDQTIMKMFPGFAPKR